MCLNFWTVAKHTAYKYMSNHYKWMFVYPHIFMCTLVKGNLKPMCMIFLRYHEKKPLSVLCIIRNINITCYLKLSIVQCFKTSSPNGDKDKINPAGTSGLCKLCVTLSPLICFYVCSAMHVRVRGSKWLSGSEALLDIQKKQTIYMILWCQNLLVNSLTTLFFNPKICWGIANFLSYFHFDFSHVIILITTVIMCEKWKWNS